jgi:hypothetical protein
MDLRGRGTEDKELRKVCGGVGERDKEDNFGPTTSGLLSCVCVGGGVHPIKFCYFNSET